MTEFIKGLDLCESFYLEVAKPLLDSEFPSLKYSAALVGYGSDVIGFDNEISTDHMWGPRFILFLEDNNFEKVSKRISDVFSSKFPYEFRGYSTNFSEPDINDCGVRHSKLIREGKINHLIEFYTLNGFFENYLGYKPIQDITINEWLTFPEHRLLAVTSGKVFHDELGLSVVREKLSFYPDDIWLFLIASQWKMISEEKAFVGRCGQVGDELGSRIITLRIINHLMRLCFLMERSYAPYSKWFGSAFNTLEISNELKNILEKTSLADHWEERQVFLSEAFMIVAEKHNSLNITPYIKPNIGKYFGRPYLVLNTDDFENEISKSIKSELLRNNAKIGSVSHFTNDTGIFDDLEICNALKILF